MANTQEPHSKVYKTQGASAIVVSSGGEIQITSGGEISLGAGASANFTSGTVALPGNLRRGYDTLIVKGAKTTATASGVVTAFTTAVHPKLKTFEVASGALLYEWATGHVEPLLYEPWRIPDDFSTGDGLYVHFTGESVSGATNDLNIAVRSGTATADLGTTAALTSTPSEQYIEVGATALPASGLLNVSIFPSAHATGAISLFSAGISYYRSSS